MSDASSFNDFDAAVRWDRYTGAEYALLACRSGEGLVNLHCRLILRHRQPADIQATQRIAAELVIAKGWINIDQLREQLQRLRNGQLQLEGLDIGVHLAEGGPYTWRCMRPHDDALERIDWPADCLEGTGESLYRLLGTGRRRELERALLGATPRPFAGWTGLAQFLGEGVALDETSTTRLDVFAPISARISSVSVGLADGSFRAVVDFESDVRRDELVMNIIPDDARVEPFSSASANWAFGEDAGSAEVGAELPPDLGMLTASLLVASRPLHECRVGAPSTRARVHANLDPDASWLRSLLGLPQEPTGDGRQQRRRREPAGDAFEHGVVALLNLAGIGAVHYGFASRDNYPDLVAFVPGAGLLVGECTTGAPTGEDVAKVHTRAEALRENAQMLPLRLLLVRLLFTPRPRSEIAERIRERAEELSVCIVDRELIEELFEMVTRGEAPDRIWWHLAVNARRFGITL